MKNQRPKADADRESILTHMAVCKFRNVVVAIALAVMAVLGTGVFAFLLIEQGQLVGRMTQLEKLLGQK